MSKTRVATAAKGKEEKKKKETSSRYALRAALRLFSNAVRPRNVY